MLLTVTTAVCAHESTSQPCLGYCSHKMPAVWQRGVFRVCLGTSSLSCCFRMDQAPKDAGLVAQASFDSLNGDSDDDAFSEVTGISRRSMSGWGSFAGLQGAERNVSRFFRRFIPSHTTAQTGRTRPFPLLSCSMLPFGIVSCNILLQLTGCL